MVKNGNKEVIKMSKKLFGVAVILFQQHVKNQPDVIKMWTCYEEYSKNEACQKSSSQRQEGKLCVYVPPLPDYSGIACQKLLSWAGKKSTG